MRDSITSLPSIIHFNKPPRLHVHEGQRRRRYRKQWRGSHQGYSGDTECLSPTASCSSEDEESVKSTGRKSVTSTTTATTAVSSWTGLSSGVRMQFYGNIPKRRTRAAKESPSQECIDNAGEGTDRENSSRVNPAPAPSHIHPEIDLSRVRVISCQEHDLRQWKKDRDFMKRVLLHQDEDQSDPSQSEDSCDTSSVSPSLVKEKRRGGLWSGPLAVFDQGSVFEFGKIDTSCSILNQIYDLDSFRRGSAFDHNTSSIQDVLNMGSSVPRTTSLTCLPALSGIGFKRDGSSLDILENECKRSKHETSVGIRSASDCSRVEQTSLTLEDAVSFSPFARIIFDAQSPHTIVHVNAAYGSLVSQGVVDASFVGQPLVDTNNLHHSEEERDIAIPTIVANHLQRIAQSPPPHQIFPVVSRVADFGIFEAYRKLQSLRSPMTTMKPAMWSFGTEPMEVEELKSGFKPEPMGSESEKALHYVSYYMLQIESNSQIKQSICRN